MELFLDGVGNQVIGAVLTKKPDIPTAQRNVTTTMVPGSSHGSLTQYQGWQDVTIKCSFQLVPTLIPGLTGIQGYNEVLRRLNAWAISAKRLKLSEDFNYYRLVKQVQIGDASPSEIEVIGAVDVTFVLDPFWYEESDPVVLSKTGTVYNPGTMDSDPLLTVYGAGTLKFSVNGNELTLLNVRDYLTVDSWQQTILHGNDSGTYDEQLNGSYPKMLPGENTITFSSGVTSMKIEGRWCWL